MHTYYVNGYNILTYYIYTIIFYIHILTSVLLYVGRFVLEVRVHIRALGGGAIVGTLYTYISMYRSIVCICIRFVIYTIHSNLTRIITHEI